MTETALQTAEMMVWIRDEQAILWHEMQEAIDSAVNRTWSIRASNMARRIVEAARLVGPTERGALPYGLEAGGVYDAVYAAASVDVRQPSEEEWARWDGMMSKYGTTRATMLPRYAPTVEAIKEGRESRYISGADE